MKKLTFQFVKEQFNLEGYTLLSKEYINSYTKLKYRCPNGHKHFVNWDCWKAGNRCPHCLGLSKPNIEDVRKSFEDKGYILLSKKYINNNTKLRYICPNFHKHSITWHDWQVGKRCYYCHGNVKLSIKYISNSFNKNGYTLLSKEYINNKTLLKYKCPNGHTHHIRWDSWARGVRCPYCFGTVKPTFAEVKNEFQDVGYTLLSKVYVNGHNKLQYKCSMGHINYITLSMLRQGHRCSICHKLSNFGSGNPNWKGGISFEPYPIYWTKQLKDSIKARDRNKCLNPDCCNQDETISVHHIDYNKKNCKLSNLITVCRSCNARANKDRAWHKSWYQAILKNRYNYKY